MTKTAMSIKKNDMVQIISGRDASTPGKVKRGRVLRVLPVTGRVVVEGMNFIKKHTRANPQKNVQGGIIEREAPLHASNVQLVCPECGAVTRVGRRQLDDGRRVRYCVKCKGVVDK
jgi:large subunit ribosomal protein L24